MGVVERAHKVIGAGFKDMEQFARAVDEELQQIADSAETRGLTIVYTRPLDYEGRVGDRMLFIDREGVVGTKGLRYKLTRASDGWYRGAALTKLR